jgi:hypothetical protein
LAVGFFEEHGARDEGQCGEELVRGAEKRPDVLVAEDGEEVAQDQGRGGRHVFVGEEGDERRRGFSGVLVVGKEFLKGEAADAGNRIERGEGKYRRVISVKMTLSGRPRRVRNPATAAAIITYTLSI